MRDTSFVVAPIRDHAFFEQAVLECQVGNAFLQGAGLAAQILHLVRGRSTGGVTSQAALACLHELLRPGVIQALGDAFLAAQLGNAVIAAQAIEHDPDLVFRREVPPGLPRMSFTTSSAGPCGDFDWRIGLSSSFLRHYDESPNPP